MAGSGKNYCVFIIIVLIDINELVKMSIEQERQVY